jgi:hypothetical protein
MWETLKKTLTGLSFLSYGFLLGVLFSQLFFGQNLSILTVASMGAFYVASLRYS